MSAKAKSKSRVIAEAPIESDLQQMATDLDQAIEGYADYYRQEQGAHRAFAYDRADLGVPSGYGCAESPRGPQPGASSNEERLYLVERVAADFRASVHYIRSLEGREKEEYLASWQEYLTQMAGFGAELIDDLQKELAEFSAAETKPCQP